MSGYAPTYPKWVKDSWAKRSELVDGQNVAEAFRRNLRAPLSDASSKTAVQVNGPIAKSVKPKR